MPRSKKDVENIAVEEVNESAVQQVEAAEEEAPAEVVQAEAAGEEAPAEAAEDEGADVVEKAPMPIEESAITQEKTVDFEVNMELSDAFFRRSISLPGSRRGVKRAAQKAFGETEDIIGDDNEELNTYARLKKIEYDILSGSANSLKPKPLYGVVSGIEEMELKGSSIKTIMVVCHLIAANAADINTDREIRSAIYKIRIPAPLFFVDEADRYSKPEHYDDLRYNMSMRVGSIIEFVVYNISLEDEDVLASRLSAMQVISYDNYLGKRARIKPGSLVKGRIVYVNKDGIVADVMGADVFIRRDELTWRYLADLTEEKEFRIGSPILVRVTSIDTAKTSVFGKEYNYVKIKASAKDAKENPNKMYFNKYEIGQKYSGYIAYHLKQGPYIVNLGEKGFGVNGEQPTCVCKAPSLHLGGTPYVGQRCVVAIVAKNEENYQINAAFTYMEP